MRVTFFIVNYRTDEHVLRLVDSLAVARDAAEGVTVDVHVLDNSKKNEAEASAFGQKLGEARLPARLHHTGTNAGYFGVLPLAQGIVRHGDADCVIYSNPDIAVEADFFLELAAARAMRGVLAPSILTLDRGFDQNPMYEERLPAKKLRRLRTVYGSAPIFTLYSLARTVKEAFAGHRRAGSRHEIYAPHGSIFVFTDIEFFLTLPRYPCFLYGEELFVAEEARRREVRIMYEPRLKALDFRHASIALLPRADLRRHLLASVSYILDRYYADGTGLAA
jgi:hypothetical protein